MKIALLWLFAVAPVPAASDWRNGGAGAGYTMEAAGAATSPDGATVTLRAPAQAAAAAVGNTSATIPAEAVRVKRLRLSGELQTSGVSGGASLWLRIDKGPAMLMLDNHSFLLPPAQTTSFRTGGAANPRPDIRVDADGVGVITMSGYSGAEPAASKKYAEDVHAGLAAARDRAACGWVLDLRPNTGGNMWPMLAGLQPFLGKAALGTFESPEGAGEPWIAGQAVGAEPPPSLAPLENAWVAVITGPRTASSGEAVTIPFKGRPHTRSFGLPTAGLSTANGTFPLSDGAMILLTMAIEVDRTGRG